MMLTNLCLLLGVVGSGQTRGPEGYAPAVVHSDVWRDLRCAADPVHVWVFFCDKGPRSSEELRAELAKLEATYPPRAIERRRLRRRSPGLFDERDIPVCADYVVQLQQTGAALRVRAPWLNAVSVAASAEQVRQIARFPFVRRIEPVRRGVPAEAGPLQSLRFAEPSGRRGFYGLSEEQLRQIGIVDMNSAGYTGSGIVIGVLDTGFQRSHQAFNQPGHVLVVLDEYDFVSDDENTAPEPGDDPDQFIHGTLVLGTLAAYKPGELIGGAYDAAFVLAKTEDVTQEVPAEEDQYVAGLHFIEAAGADVATSSLGYIDWYTQEDLDGRTAVTTIAVNAATENGLACVTAAGNRAHDGDGASLIAPADAFQVFSCGAVDAAGQIADFSSRGPTADGRVKPEVLARGVDTFTIDPFDDAGYAFASGTSLSTPLVASAVALLIQARPNWSIDQLRTALTQTADYYVAHGTHDPGYVLGYGIINVFAAAQFVFCDGDVDSDGDVDLSDLGVVLTNFGCTGGTPTLPCPGDADGDGDTDLSDLGIVLANFGGCS